MSISIELKKAEAARRMKALKLSSNIIKEFDKDHILYYSEDLKGPFKGILYWVDNEPKFRQIINTFELEHNALVYHAHLAHTEPGDLLSLLFVSDCSQEWELDNSDIQEGFPLAYVYNINEGFGEFGSIQIKPVNGGITRLA